MRDADQILLRRLVRQGDAEAFALLVKQYAGLVYGACRRVLGSDLHAADVTQETFFQFLKNAHRVSGSVGGWLHQTATHRAVDWVRQSASRRRREEAYAAGGFQESESWEEIEPLVDEALAELPDEPREMLILHFLRQQSMTEIAASKGISQATVSRRIAAALEQLRSKLRQREIIMSLATLGSLLGNAAQAAPQPLLESLAKITLTHAATTQAGLGASAAALFLGLGWKSGLGIAAFALAASTGWFMLNRSESSAPAPLAGLPELAPQTMGAPAPLNPPSPSMKPSTGFVPEVERLMEEQAVPNDLSVPAPGGRSHDDFILRNNFGGRAGGGVPLGGGRASGLGSGQLPPPIPPPGFNFSGTGYGGFSGGMAGGGAVAGTFGLQPGGGGPISSGFSNYAFGKSWSYTNGVLSQTQTVFSSSSAAP